LTSLVQPACGRRRSLRAPAPPQFSGMAVLLLLLLLAGGGSRDSRILRARCVLQKRTGIRIEETLDTLLQRRAGNDTEQTSYTKSKRQRHLHIRRILRKHTGNPMGQTSDLLVLTLGECRIRRLGTIRQVRISVLLRICMRLLRICMRRCIHRCLGHPYKNIPCKRHGTNGRMR